MSPKEWIHDGDYGPLIAVLVFIMALTAASVLFAQCCIGDSGFIRTGYDFEGYVMRKCPVCVGLPKRTHQVEVQVVEPVSTPPTTVVTPPPAAAAAAATTAPPLLAAAATTPPPPAAAATAATTMEEEKDEDNEVLEEDDDEDDFDFDAFEAQEARLRSMC